MPAFTMNHALAPHVESLIEKNKEALIKASVADEATKAKLLEINKAISELKIKDPGMVAAWGLGCGGSCMTPELPTNDFRIRPF